MRLLPCLFATCLLLSGCQSPSGIPEEESIGGERVIGGQSAGGAKSNVTVTGSGGGAAASGNLIAANSPQVVATTGLTLSGDAGGSSEAATGILTGQVRAPGGVAARSEGLVGVGQTYVSAYDMEGHILGPASKTDDAGAYRLENMPVKRLMFVRSQFEVNGKAYYLSSLARIDSTTATVDLTPMSTLSEARFFYDAPGIAPSGDVLTQAYLEAFWKATDAFQNDVQAGTMLAIGTLEDRAVAYGRMKLKHPDAFTSDVDAAFKRSAAGS